MLFSFHFCKCAVVAPVVLAEIVHSKAYDSSKLCRQIFQLLYGKYLLAHGWTDKSIVHLDKLLWSHAIRAEEFYGLGICTENLDYSTDMTEDIYRHSSPDNYLCDMYERSIRTIKSQKNNSKGIDTTYVGRELLRRFIIAYEEVNGPFCQTEAEKYPFKFDTNHDLHGPVLQNENSSGAAKKQLTWLSEKYDATNDEKLLDLMSDGVLLRKPKKKILLDTQLC